MKITLSTGKELDLTLNELRELIGKKIKKVEPVKIEPAKDPAPDTTMDDIFKKIGKILEGKNEKWENPKTNIKWTSQKSPSELLKGYREILPGIWIREIKG